MHHSAGDDDFLLKVRCRDLAQLDSLVGQELKGQDGVTRTRTTIVMRTEKESVLPPIGRG